MNQDYNGLNYYQILGVETSVNSDELKKAYRKKAKEMHPDKNPDNPNADQEFAQLQEAFETLKDDKKRVAYDNRLRADFSDGRSMRDVMRDVVMNFARRQNASTNADNPYSRANTDPEGLNIRKNFTFNINDVYFGRLDMTYERRVPGSDGDSTETVEETVEFNKSYPIVMGSRRPFISLSGLGHYSVTTESYGNLEVDMQFLPDRDYIPVWNDLMLVRQISVPLIDLLKSDYIELDHFGEVIKLPTSAFTSDKKDFRVKGRGLPEDKECKIRGPLIIQCVVDMDIKKFPKDVKKLLKAYYSEKDVE